MFFGTLEGRPVLIVDPRTAHGYWLIDRQWVRMNPGDVTFNVGLRTEEQFVKRFPLGLALFGGLTSGRFIH